MLRAAAMLALAATVSAAAAAQTPRARAATAAEADVPVVAVGYSPQLDEACARQSGGRLDSAFVAVTLTHVRDLDAQWVARGPRLLRAAREVVGAPYEFREAQAAIVTCGLPSMTFPLVLDASEFLRPSTDSVAWEHAIFVNVLFRELLQRYVSDRLARIRGGSARLLAKYAGEPSDVLDRLHVYAVMAAAYRKLGLSDELTLMEVEERKLPNAVRARAIVAAEGAETFIRELRR